MAKVLSVRVDDDLAAWVEGYAVERGVKRVQVMEGALLRLRDLAGRGVPELPEPRANGRPRVVAGGAVEAVDMEAIRAKLALNVQRAREERERKYAERGW